MFLVGFDGCRLTEDHWLVRTARKRVPGGVILFDRNVDGTVQNIESPEQLRDLVASLQELSGDTLLVAVDQEGGQVCRLRQRDGFIGSESAAVLGQQEPDISTAPAAAAMAGVLAEAGINLNLAPVVDLDFNPDNPIISRYNRSFGNRVSVVTAHARAFIAAHHACGIACCLKHFPGHGSARGDSHLGFVDITDDWREQELEPYRRLFSQGFGDAVMTAHVIHRQLDREGVPATLSPHIVKGLLRKELGFDGVTMTDDLQMRAIADRFGLKEAVQRAVLAGVDLMIIGNNLERSGNVLDEGVAAVQELLDKGLVDEDSIVQSLERIAVLKRKIEGEYPWTSDRHTVRL
jgi:beta-N-acetylhexosaminidase